MEKKTYTYVQETIYSERLDNGLTIKLIPKNDFNKTYALLFTDFGSIDQTFIPIGENHYRTFPMGIAHFLEHTLFEAEEGDVSHLFSSQGASVNAYTSNTKTAFMCSFTSNLKQNINTLLDFVQTPYFNQESVENEKNIITQEIQMYKDDPDWHITVGLLENLYPNHPLSTDVAGTEDSVQQIDVEMLKVSYDTFYHPGNMQIVVVGKLDPNDTLQLIKENQSQKKFTSSSTIDRLLPVECSRDIIKYKETRFSVNIPKVNIGVKGTAHKLIEDDAFRHLIKMEIALDLLLGDTSSAYLSLYNDELIDDSFSYEYIFERSFDYVSIGGDTKFPEKLADRLLEIMINNQDSLDLTEEHFSLIKKKLIGQYIQDLNSLEFIANQFAELPFSEHTIFDSLAVLNSISLEEVSDLARTYFREEVMSVLLVNPEK